MPYRAFNEKLLKDVKNLTPEEYSEAKLVKLAYKWRENFDAEMNDIEKHEPSGPGLDYDDPVSLANAKKDAKERATMNVNESLSNDNDNEIYVDLEHTNPDTGGITFVNKKSGVAYLTLHGKQAGLVNKFGEGPLNRSAGEVNALDDRSVRRTAFSNPFKNADHIPELYPDLEPQADSLLKDFGKDNVKVVSYSNGGAKHLYLNRTKDIPGTSFDPFLGPRQARDIARGTKAPFKLITTDNLSVSDPGLGLAPGLGENVNVKYVPHEQGVLSETFPRIDDYVMQNHSLEGPYSEDTKKTTTGGRGILIDSAKDTVKGMATAAAAGLLTSELDPDATGQTKLLETAGTNVALDSGAAGGVALITGSSAGAAAAAASGIAAEVAAPTVAAYEAGDAVYNAMSKATEKFENRPAAGALTGSVTGATAVASATATSKVISTGINAIKAARAGEALQQAANASEGGMEMAEIGGEAAEAAEAVEAVEAAATAVDAGVEMGTLAAVEGSLATATEVTGAAAAVQGGVDPVADVAFLGALVATGLAAGVGAVLGAFNEGEKQKREAKEKLGWEQAKADSNYRIQQHRLQVEETKKQDAITDRKDYIKYIQHKGSKYQDQGKAQGDTVREALAVYDENLNQPGYNPYRDLYAETAVERNKMKAMNLESEDPAQLMNSDNFELSQSAT